MASGGAPHDPEKCDEGQNLECIAALLSVPTKSPYLGVFVPGSQWESQGPWLSVQRIIT
jgi:hypothetical protein